MWRGAMHDHGVPRPREAAPLPPDHVRDHPACGGVRPRVARWVGNGRGMVLEDWTEAVRSRGRDAPTDGHPHPSGHHACGLLAIARGGETLGGLEGAHPTRRLGGACIAGAPALGGTRVASRAWVARLTPRGWSTRGGRAALVLLSILPQAIRASYLPHEVGYQAVSCTVNRFANGP
jgi:hypothetical protein